MNARDDAYYRLILARDYLKLAEDGLKKKFWWVCAANSQMAVENGVKAFIACFEPVEKIHEIERQLAALLKQGQLSDAEQKVIEELIPIAERYGRAEHIRATYGNDQTFTPPSKIYKEADARRALADANKVIRAAQRVIKRRAKG